MSRSPLLMAFALVALAWSPGLLAQDKPKDDLDRLLENLEKKDKEKDKPADAKPEPAKGKEKAPEEKKSEPSKDKAPADPKTGEVAPKDQDLDSLLEKLGGTTDTPDTKKERPSAGAGDSPMPPKPGEGKADELTGEKKQIDDVLIDRSGKIRKKPQQQGQQSGPLSDAEKQMREVEKRLSKTDTGEKTRQEQGEIVKKLDTILKEIRKQQGQQQPGQGRKTAQAGQKPGDKPGQPGSDPNGNTAQGVGPQKPARPSFKTALNDDKNPWGNLPPSVLEERANVSRELPLEAKKALIDKYFLSVAKKSLRKGD